MGQTFSRPLMLALAVAYPAYKSFKALETDGDLDDDRQWLTYWVVQGAFQLAEFVADNSIVSWAPLYYWAKLALVCWLMHPKTRGALTVYRTLLLPHLVSRQPRVLKRRVARHPAHSPAQPRLTLDLPRPLCHACLTPARRKSTSARSTARWIGRMRGRRSARRRSRSKG